MKLILQILYLLKNLLQMSKIGGKRQRSYLTAEKDFSSAFRIACIVFITSIAIGMISSCCNQPLEPICIINKIEAIKWNHLLGVLAKVFMSKQVIDRTFGRL